MYLYYVASLKTNMCFDSHRHLIDGHTYRVDWTYEGNKVQQDDVQATSTRSRPARTRAAGRVE